MKNTSLFVSQLLPQYIRDDDSYSTFIKFLEHYYDWFDTNYKLRDFEDNIDVDETINEFLDLYKNDFLPNFPKSIITDKRKLLKIGKEFFLAKGTPASFKFLFRALYNSDSEVTNMNEFVLIASGGKWIAPKYIRIKSTELRWLNTSGYRIFGEQSKTFAVIEDAKFIGNFIQLYISNIERLFKSGETIRVLDSTNKDVYTLNDEIIDYTDTPPVGASKLTTKIVGSLSSIKINPLRRGQFYKIGDPVVVYGGLNEDVQNPIGATAEIDSVTQGGIISISVVNGGYGYAEYPSSQVSVYSDGIKNNTVNAFVSLVDHTIISNVSIATTVIGPYADTTIGAASYSPSGNLWSMAISNANANTILNDALTFTTFPTYPIKELSVLDKGSGISGTPEIKVDTILNLTNNYTVSLYDIGMLAPIQIDNPGSNYAVGDIIYLTGGDGHGARANVTAVTDGVSGIANVSYIKCPDADLPIGGIGFTEGGLPTITISSVSGVGANLYIPGILSTGATFTSETDKIGEIETIRLINPGEDYFQTPNVSIRIQDILVSNVTNISLLTNGYSKAYQGPYETPTYISNIYSIELLEEGNPSIFLDNLYRLRVFDYRGAIDTLTPGNHIIVRNTINGEDIAFLLANTTTIIDGVNFVDGKIEYGDGRAYGYAEFLSGITQDTGFYLNKNSLISENSVIQSDIYNKNTYMLSTEQSLSKYKNSISSLIHPIGSQIINRYLIKSNSDSIKSANSNTFVGSDYSATYTLYGNATTGYSNVIYVSNNAFDVSNTFIANTYITISTNTTIISSAINTSNNISNTITLLDYVFVGKSNTAISNNATTLTVS